MYECMWYILIYNYLLYIYKLYEYINQNYTYLRNENFYSVGFIKYLKTDSPGLKL